MDKVKEIKSYLKMSIHMEEIGQKEISKSREFPDSDKPLLIQLREVRKVVYQEVLSYIERDIDKFEDIDEVIDHFGSIQGGGLD